MAIINDYINITKREWLYWKVKRKENLLVNRQIIKSDDLTCDLIKTFERISRDYAYPMTNSLMIVNENNLIALIKMQIVVTMIYIYNIYNF